MTETAKRQVNQEFDRRFIQKPEKPKPKKKDCGCSRAKKPKQ